MLPGCCPTERGAYQRIISCSSALINPTVPSSGRHLRRAADGSSAFVRSIIRRLAAKQGGGQNVVGGSSLGDSSHTRFDVQISTRVAA